MQVLDLRSGRVGLGPPSPAENILNVHRSISTFNAEGGDGREGELHGEIQERPLSSGAFLVFGTETSIKSTASRG